MRRRGEPPSSEHDQINVDDPLNRPDFRAGIIHDATTDETAELGTKLSSLRGAGSGATDETRNVHLALTDRIDIAPGEIHVSISAS